MRARLFRFGSVACLTGITAWWTLSVGCTSESPPTAPSDMTTGITIYVHANFEGHSMHLTRDTSYLSDLMSGARDCGITTEFDDYYHNWDDCISSVRVESGWRATLYEHPDFKGASLDLTEDAPNLQLAKGPCRRDDWNDCTSSIRVQRR